MILTIALLRAIPYALAAILAWQKGYKRLSLAIAWVILIVLLNYVNPMPPEFRAFTGGVTALLLLWHVVDLKQRR